MDTPKILWGFLWRMSLLGIVLGALLGAAYGAALLSLGAVFADLVDTGDMLSNIASRIAAMGLGFVFGTIFGTLHGVPVGLFLGMVNGLIMGVLTRIFYHPHADVRDYRKVAGWVCASASVLALLAAWGQQDFKPYAFALGRLYPGALGGGLLDLVFIAVLPMLVASYAMWWSGRKAAGWYAREASGSDS